MCLCGHSHEPRRAQPWPLRPTPRPRPLTSHPGPGSPVAAQSLPSSGALRRRRLRPRPPAQLPSPPMLRPACLTPYLASSTGRPAPRHRPVMPWPCPKQGNSLLAQRPWAPAPFDVITALVRRCCAVASPASSGTSLAPQPALVASLAVLFDLVYFAALSFMQTGASAHTPAPALLFSCNFQTDTHTSLPTQNSNKEVSFVVRIALKEYPGQIRELE